jgi:hypothetical protein
MLEGADMLSLNPCESERVFRGLGEYTSAPSAPHVSLKIESDAAPLCQEVLQNKLSMKSRDKLKE